jgi:putative sigma-54 modulation protein
MRIEYTGRQTEVPRELRALAEKKLKKLERVLHGITDAHVVLAADKHRQIAEVSVRSPHLVLAATEESADPGVSLTTVIEKLTRQAQRQMGKRQERKRRGPVRGTPAWDGASAPAAAKGAEVRIRIFRSRRFVAKPMTVEEAALEIDGSAHGLVVFRNAGTEQVSVLYRRQDGHLGLIEPEA